MIYGIGVNQHGLQPEMRKVEKTFDKVWAKHGLGEPVCKSAADREHMRYSWHYFGMAIDVTLQDIPTHLVYPILDDLRRELTAPYQIIHHRGSHIHVECDIDAFPQYQRGAHQ